MYLSICQGQRLTSQHPSSIGRERELSEVVTEERMGMGMCKTMILAQRTRVSTSRMPRSMFNGLITGCNLSEYRPDHLMSSIFGPHDDENDAQTHLGE